MNTDVAPQETNLGAICDRLKRLRIRVCGPRGQSHFASLLHLSPSTYNYYEKGRTPPVDVLDRASRVTGAPLLWLIRGEPTDFSLESLNTIECATDQAPADEVHHEDHSDHHNGNGNGAHHSG